MLGRREGGGGTVEDFQGRKTELESVGKKLCQGYRPAQNR